MDNLTITEVGTFFQYAPDPYPKDLPPGILFTKRSSDGADFYSLVHGPEPVVAPAEGVWYALGLPLEDGTLDVQSVYKEPDRVVPAGGVTILKIEGYTGTDALKDLGMGKYRYDPVANALV